MGACSSAPRPLEVEAVDVETVEASRSASWAQRRQPSRRDAAGERYKWLARTALEADIKVSDRLKLLRGASQSSSVLRALDEGELVLLATMAKVQVLAFKLGENVMTMNEPATYFGIVLYGALAVNDISDELMAPDLRESFEVRTSTGPQLFDDRGVGTLCGEMALFTGGARRNATMIARADGCMLVITYEQLTRLRQTHRGLHDKLATQLAYSAMERQCEDEGTHIEDMPEWEKQRRLHEMLRKLPHNCKAAAELAEQSAEQAAGTKRGRKGSLAEGLLSRGEDARLHKMDGVTRHAGELLQKVHDAANSHEQAAAVREVLLALSMAQASATAALEFLEPPKSVASRAGFLVALEERLPRNDERAWKEEWGPLSVMTQKLTRRSIKRESMRRTGVEEEDDDDDDEEPPEAGFSSIEQMLERKRSSSIEHMLERKRDKIDRMEKEMKWVREDAEAFVLLSLHVPALSLALRSGEKDFAASTHRLVDAIVANRTAKARGSSWGPPLLGPPHAAVPPPLYRNLKGLKSLVDDDPQWEDIETPDSNGFVGFLCSAVTTGTASDNNFEEGGFRTAIERTQRHSGGDSTQAEKAARPVQDSPVVRFESAPDDGIELHSAVMTSKKTKGAFPPNTLFRVVRVEPDGFDFTRSDGRVVRVKQKLIVVRATYTISAHGGGGASDGGKFVGFSQTLTYASRDAFVKGLHELLARPFLTMEQECTRELAWTDWAGKGYTIADEFDYVNGSATRKAGCTPGVRDEHHDGRTVDDFVAIAREYVLERLAQKGGGTAESHAAAVLTRDEVIAVRLYSGPAFQPINNFLRQLSGLRGELQESLAMHPRCTFLATVGHICSAIRKLSAVATEEEARQRLYRGVRGQLPKGFFIPDAHGLCCAVETAFMSTSCDEQAAIGYLSKHGENVLWQLQSRPESDGAYHIGADISRLSQFSSEKEVLYPPYTMLLVQDDAMPHVNARSRSLTSNSLISLMSSGKAKDDDSGVEATSKGVGKREVEWINHHGEPEPRAFLPVSVRPYFV